MSETQSQKKKRKASKPAIAALLVLLVVVLISRDRIADMARMRGILDADAPDPVAIRDVLQRSANPARQLRSLWRSGKIPHRWEALSFLNRNVRKQPELISAAGDIIDESAWDRDITTRVLGLNLARITGRPGWLDAARAQLDDPDHDLRLECLHVLRRGEATNALHDIVGRLKDPNREIAVLAAGLLRNYTGGAFGGSNLVAVAETWWQTNRANYPPLPAPPMEPDDDGLSFAHLIFEDFKRVRVPLKGFAGKPVLISFFGTWSPPSMMQMPALSMLQITFGDKIKVMGVGIDPLAGGAKHGKDFDAAGARTHVIRVTSMRRFQYDVVFDPTGVAMLQLEGAKIPSHILLDADLRLIRRFTGSRDLRSLTRIVAELTGVNP